MKADYKFGNLAIFIPWFVNNDCKQEGIPVGCVQTTVVAATDVRTWEGSTYWSGVCLLGGIWLSEGLPYTPQDGPWERPLPPGWTHKHKQNIEFRPKFREIVENGGILCRKCI